MLTWENVTLRQFQEIVKLKSDKDQTDLDEKVVSIMHNISINAVGEMKMPDFNKAVKECNFLLKQSEIPGKPLKHIQVGFKKYFICYKPNKLRQRQYVEIRYYADKPIENMHLILASLVQPVKFGFTQKNKVKNHQRIADEMLNARIIDVYHSCLFFCKLYCASIKVIQPYLITDMMNQGVSKTQAESLTAILTSTTDGYFQQSK